MLEFIENIMEEKQISQKMINEVRARPEQRIINEIKNRLERQENSANTPPDYA